MPFEMGFTAFQEAVTERNLLLDNWLVNSEYLLAGLLKDNLVTPDEHGSMLVRIEGTISVLRQAIDGSLWVRRNSG